MLAGIYTNLGKHLVAEDFAFFTKLCKALL